MERSVPMLAIASSFSGGSRFLTISLSGNGLGVPRFISSPADAVEMRRDIRNQVRPANKDDDVKKSEVNITNAMNRCEYINHLRTLEKKRIIQSGYRTPSN